MILNQTLVHDRKSSSYIQDFINLLPKDTTRASHLGATRIASIPKFIGIRKDEQGGLTVDSYLNKPGGPVEAWKSQRPNQSAPKTQSDQQLTLDVADSRSHKTYLKITALI